jgi:hypothetical protein
MTTPLLAPLRAIALSAMLAVTLPGTAAGRVPAVTLLQPGGYDSADLDLSVLPARGWLALVAHGGHWELVPAKVELVPEIRSPDQPTALVLLHGRGLSTGTVPTLEARLPDGVSTPELDPAGKGASHLGLSFNAHRYRLRLLAHGPDRPRELALEDDHTRTRLDTDTDQATVMWAGDLDGDGHLDLIISTDHEDGQSADTCLYLSSAAAKGQLVKQVSCQGFSG